MKANDMKAGDTGTLKSGWRFEILDNRRGMIRLAKVINLKLWWHPQFDEVGSIYIHDIAYVDRPSGRVEILELSPAQAKKAKVIKTAMNW